MRLDRIPVLACLAALLATALLAFPAAAQTPADDAPSGDYGGYLTWPEIRSAIDRWKRARPELVHEISIGRTVEGREIPALRLSDHAAADEDEPEVLLLAGTHPREQPPQVLLVRLVDDILEGYGEDPRLTALLDEREVWVVPVLNVDGKVWDMKAGNGRDRGAAWRKNRRPNPDGTRGVDLNRQYPVRWGASTERAADPESDYFVGWGPLAEPEVAALDAFFRERPLRVYVDVHSPFQAIYSPRYLTAAEAERYGSLAEGLRARQATPYDATKPRVDADPPARRGGDCGLGHDWAYYVHGVYAFTFEIFADPKWYPPLAQIDREYANFREPMLWLIEQAASLPRPREGSARLAGASLDREPSPGATVVWTPAIEGPWTCAVLVAESPAVRVASEFRVHPGRSGFVLEIPEDAAPGAEVPLALYVWDADRGRSVARATLRIAAPPPAGRIVRVGIYDHGADGGGGVTRPSACLDQPEFRLRVLTAEEIRAGALGGVDVLIVPGGSASKQARELGDEGLAAIRAFVERGGGYVGFCAGAYLATATYSWSLSILDAEVLDREHWARGTGTVRIRLTPEGKDLLGRADDEVPIYYGQGPLLGPAGKEGLPDFTALATYATEIAKKGAPQGVMAGTTAIAAGEYGRGRVLCFSPHPERTGSGLETFVERAVRWAARRP